MKHLLVVLVSASVFLVPASSSAVLVLNWSFDDAGSSGPITGTLTFNSINPGQGGTGLTPDSIIITSAPGHDFAGPYTLGSEMIGNTAAWNFTANPASELWHIDTNNNPTAGEAVFGYILNSDYDNFSLRHPLHISNSRLHTDVNSTATMTGQVLTAGTASFVAVPEVSAFWCLGAVALGVLGWQTNRQRRRTRFAQSCASVTVP